MSCTISQNTNDILEKVSTLLPKLVYLNEMDGFNMWGSVYQTHINGSCKILVMKYFEMNHVDKVMDILKIIIDSSLYYDRCLVQEEVFNFVKRAMFKIKFEFKHIAESESFKKYEELMRDYNMCGCYYDGIVSQYAIGRNKEDKLEKISPVKPIVNPLIYLIDVCGENETDFNCFIWPDEKDTIIEKYNDGWRMRKLYGQLEPLLSDVYKYSKTNPKLKIYTSPHIRKINIENAYYYYYSYTNSVTIMDNIATKYGAVIELIKQIDDSDYHNYVYIEDLYLIVEDEDKYNSAIGEIVAYINQEEITRKEREDLCSVYKKEYEDFFGIYDEKMLDLTDSCVPEYQLFCKSAIDFSVKEPNKKYDQEE